MGSGEELEGEEEASSLYHQETYLLQLPAAAPDTGQLFAWIFPCKPGHDVEADGRDDMRHGEGQGGDGGKVGGDHWGPLACTGTAGRLVLLLIQQVGELIHPQSSRSDKIQKWRH